MKYAFSPELQAQATEISRILFPHIDITRVKCFVSEGSSTRRTIARCHTIGKLMQKTIGVPAHYGIEFISKNFNKLPEDEKTKVIIHELMHIPHAFGGGFRHHDHVCEKNVNLMFKTYKAKTEPDSGIRKWIGI
jgi:predicted metallopeptidase